MGTMRVLQKEPEENAPGDEFERSRAIVLMESGTPSTTKDLEQERRQLGGWRACLEARTRIMLLDDIVAA